MQDAESMQEALNAFRDGGATFVRIWRELQSREYPLAYDRGLADVFKSLRSVVKTINFTPTLAGLKAAMIAGNCDEARLFFPVGTLIQDVWTDQETGEVHNMPFRITHYGQALTEDWGRYWAVFLLRQYGVPFAFPFDAPEQPLAPGSRNKNGYNRYAQSNVDWWLNSFAAPGEGWFPRNPYDVLSEELQARSGYLAGCSPELLEAISPVMLEIPYYSPGGELLDYDWIARRLFLPSAKEMAVDTKNPSDSRSRIDEETWSYFTGISDIELKSRRLLKTNPPIHESLFLAYGGERYFLRTPEARYSGSGHAYDIGTNGGGCYGSPVCERRTYAPACVILGNKVEPPQ